MPTLKNKKSTTNNTFAKIEKILAENNARMIQFDFDSDGKKDCITFSLQIGDQLRGFRLPAMVENVTQILYGNRRRGGNSYGPTLEITQSQKDQAYKTAWANIRDWLDANMALVKTRQVQMDQVFLPYMVNNSGGTLYDNYLGNTALYLGDGK